MNIRSYDATGNESLSARFAAASTAHGVGSVCRALGHIQLGISELMSSESKPRRSEDRRHLGLDFDVREGSKTILHHGFGWEESDHRMKLTIQRPYSARKIHEPTALGVDWSSSLCEAGDGVAHRSVVGKFAGENFRIASAEIDSVDGRKLAVADGREPHELRPDGLEPSKIVVVVEVKV